jgi:hypothetical protein
VLDGGDGRVSSAGLVSLKSPWSASASGPSLPRRLQLRPRPIVQTFPVELVILLQLGQPDGHPRRQILPDGRPARVHTCTNRFNVSYPDERDGGLRLSAFAGPLRRRAAAKARLVSTLDQPVVATN